VAEDASSPSWTGMLTETVEATVRSNQRLADFMAYCRSPESRECWPGVQDVHPQEGGIFYRIGVEAPGLNRAELLVEEHLRASFEDGAGFESALVFTWITRKMPAGLVASAWATYRFTEEESGTRLDFSLRYIMPRAALSLMTNRTRFVDSVRRAWEVYVGRLGQPADEITLSSVSDMPAVGGAK
jgi:hypothetical protein